jgi:hypothetical protein
LTWAFRSSGGSLVLVDQAAAADLQLVRIALASGDRDLAESATASAEERAGINPETPALLASAVHARGLLTGRPSLLAQAASILEAGQRRLALASALEDLAAAQIWAGQGDQTITARPSPGQLRRLRGPLGPGAGALAPPPTRDPAASSR